MIVLEHIIINVFINILIIIIVNTIFILTYTNAYMQEVF